MLIMRKVAMCAYVDSPASVSEFEKFWPSPYKKEKIEIDFSSDEYREWYREMKRKNNIK